MIAKILFLGSCIVVASQAAGPEMYPASVKDALKVGSSFTGGIDTNT